MRRTPRLGLRARITLAFALGSMLLSVALSTSTWAFLRESQLNLRESAHRDTIVGNAEDAADLLRGTSTPTDSGTGIQGALGRMPTLGGTTPMLWVEEGTNGTSPSYSADSPTRVYEDIPRSLRTVVENGQPASMRFRLANTPYMVVGIPLPSVGAAYFELVELSDVESALDLAAAYLTGASILITLAGGALGWWASRRTLLPLTDVGLAAHAIAGGRLDTRLEAANDPDLAVLVSSFNEMASTLQARIERDARFASDVSHELRSPLMTLAASVEVLETRRDELPERSQAALDLLVDDVNRFQQLVADLLEISRFDAGAAHLDLEPVLLPEFLSQAVRATTHSPVPVVTDETSDDLVVAVDKRRMAQVVANLLDNAEKHAGGASAVVVTRRDDPQGVDIIVEDHGPGIDEADRQRVFERFARGVSAGARGVDTGSGLGLSLVAEHVALHGGQVSVENRADGSSGARFVVSLPIDADLLDGEEDERDLSDVAPVDVDQVDDEAVALTHGEGDR